MFFSHYWSKPWPSWYLLFLVHNWGFYFSDKKEYFPLTFWLFSPREEQEGYSLLPELALSKDCSSIIQQRVSLDIQFQSLRDDLFKKMFRSRSLKSSFLFFVLTPHHKRLKLPPSAELFCEMLMLDLSIIRGNLQGWNVQLQTAIFHLINNSLGKQACIDFKDYTFIEKRNRRIHIFWRKNELITFWLRSTWERGPEMFHSFRCISIPISGPVFMIQSSSDFWGYQIIQVIMWSAYLIMRNTPEFRTWISPHPISLYVHANNLIYSALLRLPMSLRMYILQINVW